MTKKIYSGVNFTSEVQANGSAGTAGQALVSGGSGQPTSWATVNATIAINTSATAPSNAKAGDEWLDPNTGNLFVYYNDGNTSQWVQTASGLTGGTDIRGRVGSLETRMTTNEALDVTQNGRLTALESYAPQSPNYIINGAFDVWQRYTGAQTFTANGNAYYVADRWLFGCQLGAGVTSEIITKVSDSTTNETYAQVQQYAASGFIGGHSRVVTILEAQQVMPLLGNTVTFSIQVATPSGMSAFTNAWFLAVRYDTNDSTINSTAFSTTVPESIGSGVTITSPTIKAAGNSSTNWSTYSATFTLPTNARRVAIVMYSTSNTNNNAGILFRRAQLELGSYATTFRRAGQTLQGELAACQRYYETGFSKIYGSTLGTGAAFSTQFRQIKRAAPSTISTSSPPSGLTDASSGISIEKITADGFSAFRAASEISFSWKADAEL